MSESGRSLLLEHLSRRVLVVDGAMGTSIHNCSCSLEEDYLGRENCTDILVRTRPELIGEIHETFLKVGADCVETDTFGANRLVLSDFDDEVASWAYELNKQAAEVARAACDRHSTSDKPRFALGSMGPGTKLITLGQVSWETMLDSYREQALGLIDGGVDAFIIETCQDLLQVKCATNAILDALAERGRSTDALPILVSVTMETTGTMLLGSEIGAVVNALRPFPIASLGLNCATGPVEMAEHLAYLSRHWDRHISVVPNAGLPALVDGETVYPLGSESFAESMDRILREYGPSMVGGCCGTTPTHIERLVEIVDGRAPVKRDIAPHVPGCSSLYSFVEFEQDKSFLIVAERTNANGSRKFKRLLDEENWDGLVSMARDEMRDGSHLLDVCVDFVGRDGVVDMAEVVSRYVRQVNAPLMLDSTDAKVLEAGLKRAGGRCIVNSINLEDGEKRLDEVCPLLKRYGAACVALTIDEDPQAGMAKTAERKVEIAARLHDLYTRKWGLDENDLLFDPLTFTIATGNAEDRCLGLETLRGIELISERFPKCGILLGLSNISFGLRPPARAVLNSVFLHEARQRGLTAAIVHVSKILPQDRIPEEHWEAARWLIFNRRGDDRPEGMPESFDPLLHFIGLFPEEGDAVEAVATADLTLEERLQRHIVDGEHKNLEATLDEALETHPPLTIINEHLLAGMKVVGELFGSGRMQLPFVLQSASVMKAAVAHLQPHMEKSGVSDKPKAKIVLATVSGDVHDIGKNLVDIILSNNGYQVFNLGIKQPLTTMIEACRKHEADAIGMSGLLVKSVGVMEQNLKELNGLKMTVPVLLGGAALTRHYAEGKLRESYGGPLYFGRDAFEGLAICDALADGRLAELDDEIDARVGKRAEVVAKVAASKAARPARSVPEKSSVRRDLPIPTPPFWGDRLVESLDLDDIYPFINTNALFRGQWGYKPGAMSADEYASLVAETVEPAFERLKAICRDERILRPAVVYGYFPCNADGDELVVFDPEDHDREVERFPFPRQSSEQRLCIADYFRPLASDGGADDGVRDVVPLTCVTMGIEVSHRAKQLFERNEYTEYLYMHGMGVETAEALAELWHKRIRMELGIGGDDSPKIKDLFQQKYRGIRYSFGYPACPDMSHQEKLFRLINPGRIGCVLTENWQIDPEQSTSAIVVHHPEARYFATREEACAKSDEQS